MVITQRTIMLGIAVLLLFLALSSFVVSTPDSVTVEILGNTTKVLSNGTIFNGTSGEDDTSGGRIFTINMTGSNANSRWKAYVGNASGTLTLDDASGNTIFDWRLTTTSGEVYTTRQGSTINWTGIGCAQRNVTELESVNLSHSSAEDNITATFISPASSPTLNSESITVGFTTIGVGECYVTHPYQNSTGTNQFEEVVLYDGGNNGTFTLTDYDASNISNVIYAQNLENDEGGFDNGTTYDFQLIVPEVGSAGFASSTAYYFYLELS